MLRFCHKLILHKSWHVSRSSCTNNIHTSKTMMIDATLLKEIKIPVAWGHIAGKWWGNPNVQPVLALHGFQDNASTFDALVPLLDVEAVLAVDMPGHGRSSHIPVGFPYDYMEAVCILRYLILHLKWSEPLTLMGHSFGSSLSFVYSALYPKEVSKYVSLDCSRHHISESPDTVIASMRNTIEKVLECQEKSPPPEYTKEELLEVFFKERRGPEGWIAKESCEILLRRGTSLSPNGKVFLSRDPKLKLMGRLTFDTWLSLAAKITCNVLSIQAENGVVRDDHKGEQYRKAVDIILKNSPKSKHVILPGYHHVHLDNAKIVANEITKFLSS